DPEGRGRVLSLSMTADGTAAPRRSPEAGRDVVERPALARAAEPTSTHRDVDARPASPSPTFVAPTAAPPVAPAGPPTSGGGLFGRFVDEDFAAAAAPVAGAAAPVIGGALRGGARGILDGGGLAPLLDQVAPAGGGGRGALDALIGGARGLLGLGLGEYDGAEPQQGQPLGNEHRRRIVETVCGLETGQPRYDAINPDGEYRGRFGRDHPYFERAHAGLGFGIVHFGQDAGDLGRLLQAMRTRDADAFQRIFGPSADAVVETCTAAGPGSLDSPEGRSARVQPVDGHDLWAEPWLARFRAAGAHPPFQAAQNQLASDLYLEPMVRKARRLGVATERGLAMMMDRAVQMGAEAAASFFVNAAGTVSSDATRGAALRALVGASGLEDYQRGRGLQPTGTWSVETKAQMIADLRAMGPESPVAVPAYDELLDRFVAAADGAAWAARFTRLRRHPDLADNPFAEA
ncbi:MAG: chitosanase, partial [Brevundimonas sp.]